MAKSLSIRCGQFLNQGESYEAERKNGWEVFEYDSRLLSELEDLGCKELTPYHPASYEAYFEEIDEYKKIFPELEEKLKEYKQSIIHVNDKSTWGIVRYNGESNLNFTKGQCYYVPIFENNGKYIIGGVIDDEEFTFYAGFSGATEARTHETEDGVVLLDQVDFSMPTFEIVVDYKNVLASKPNMFTLPKEEKLVLTGELFKTKYWTVLVFNEQDCILKVGNIICYEGADYVIKQVIPPSKPDVKWSIVIEAQYETPI